MTEPYTGDDGHLYIEGPVEPRTYTNQPIWERLEVLDSIIISMKKMLPFADGGAYSQELDRIRRMQQEYRFLMDHLQNHWEGRAST